MWSEEPSDDRKRRHPDCRKRHVPYDAWEKAVSGSAKCGLVIQLIDNYGSGLVGTAAVLHRTDGSFLTRDTDAARFRVKINRQLGRFTTLAHEPRAYLLRPSRRRCVGPLGGSFGEIDDRPARARSRSGVVGSSPGGSVSKQDRQSIWRAMWMKTI